MHSCLCQGDCGAVPANFGVAEGAIKSPALAATKPGQCVLVSNDRVFQFTDLSSPVWVDNLLFRLVWDLSVKTRTFVNVLGGEASELWFTNVTVQGDTSAPARSRAMDPFRASSQYWAGARCCLLYTACHAFVRASAA
jgi:hypothetical protein